MAFKHVLIRDVAYGMLPKAVRSRKHFEVGAFLEERAGDRTDEVVALLAEHYGRAAALGRESGVAPQELESMRARALRFLEEAGDAAAHLYANREAAAHYRHARAIAPESAREAGVRIGEKLGDVSLRLGPRGRGDRRVVGLPRVAPRPGGPRAGGGPPPQDRRRAVAQGRAQGGDRALPEGHQPAEGRPAADRARAPVRGGRLAVPPHRRQHARHLRVREGAAAGRAARRDARRQPRARDLRPRVRPDRRHGEGAPEPRARRGAGARLGRRRDDPRAVGARPAARDLRGRREGRARGVRGGARARGAGGHAAGPGGAARVAGAARGLLRRLGAASRSPPRRARRWPSARGSWASCACRTRCAGCCAGARAGSARRPCCSTARTSWPSRWAGPRSPSRRCSGSRSRCATRATSTAPPPRSTRRSRSASAPA